MSLLEIRVGSFKIYCWPNLNFNSRVSRTAEECFEGFVTDWNEPNYLRHLMCSICHFCLSSLMVMTLKSITSDEKHRGMRSLMIVKFIFSRIKTFFLHFFLFPSTCNLGFAIFQTSAIPDSKNSSNRIKESNCARGTSRICFLFVHDHHTAPKKIFFNYDSAADRFCSAQKLRMKDPR